MRYSVDPKSRDLAEYFLPDGAPEDVKRGLAQAIQDAVEGYLLTEEERAETASAEPCSCFVSERTGDIIGDPCQACMAQPKKPSDQPGESQ